MRAYPTARQQRAAADLLAAHCELYNAALQERRDAWRLCHKSISYGGQSAQLWAIRECRPDIARWSFTGQQQTLRRLNRAFEAFYQRCKKGETPGYPRFRSRARFDTVDHVNGDGARWTPSEGRWARAYFQGVGTLKVSEHTQVVGRVTQVSLTRDGRRWYVVVTAESEPVPLPPTGREVGVDVGIARFLTTSDGEIVANPRFLRAASVKMVELQQRLAGCKPGSGNRRRTKRAVAKLHRKTANQRRDFHHQTARRLVDTCDAIAVEDLRVRNMTGRPKPKPDPDNPGRHLPNGAAAKAGLNKSILDAAWGQFILCIEAKAESAGRRVVKVNPGYTSIDCHRCGARCERPRQNTVICPTCGACDADVNGARNIAARAGLGSRQPTTG